MPYYECILHTHDDLPTNMSGAELKIYSEEGENQTYSISTFNSLSFFHWFGLNNANANTK